MPDRRRFSQAVQIGTCLGMIRGLVVLLGVGDVHADPVVDNARGVATQHHADTRYPFPGPADSPPTGVAEQIREAVASYVQAMTAEEPGRIDTAIPPVDPPPNWGLCNQPLTVRLPSGTDHVLHARLVQVVCPQPVWQIWVPYRITRWERVVVAKHPIPLGKTIQATDLHIQEVDTLQRTYAPLTSAEEVVGWVAKKPIRAGEPLTANGIQAPLLIRRNQKITVEVNKPGLRVTADAIALSDGRMGEWIRAQNTHSKRIIEGQVQAAGQLVIPP